jgi:hypothetical protein
MTIGRTRSGWAASRDFERSMDQLREIISRDATPGIQEFRFALFKIERKWHPWRRRSVKKWGRC